MIPVRTMPATGAIGAAPRHVKIFERQETGNEFVGGAYVDHVLKAAQMDGSFVDWGSIPSPVYGCVGIAESGNVGFVTGATKEFVWLLNGKLTLKIPRGEMGGYAWPIGVDPPSRQLVEGYGRVVHDGV